MGLTPVSELIKVMVFFKKISPSFQRMAAGQPPGNVLEKSNANVL
jgi:hypothetical protein